MNSPVAVDFVELHRHFGEVRGLDGLDLSVEPGELVCLLGPSGCGKTTALRILAGLDHPTSGEVKVGGKDITGVPANKRDMGMVFQAYSLFPHLTAADNVAFGLKLRGTGAAARRKRAGEMLELVGLSAHTDRYPHQLSGGQQQRVALARALAFQPSVLLLDEPLSALDAKVRVQLRDEIRRVQLEVGTTTLFVTHDQEEALAVSDRVAVMNAGRLEQLATPAELYSSPATPFVGEFVGLSNRIPAAVNDGHVSLLGHSVDALPGSVTGPGVALVRPEVVGVEPDEAGNADIVSLSFRGPVTHVVCALTSQAAVGPGGVTADQEITAQIPSGRAQRLSIGQRVRVTIEPTPVLVIAG